MYATITDARLFYSNNEINILINNKDGTTNEEALEKALKSASSEIDIYLSRRYKTPLFKEYDVIPEIVKEWTVIVAVYKRSRELDKLTDEKRKRYEDIIATLKDIAKGVANLPDEGKIPVDPENPNIEEGKYSAFLEGSPRLFNRKTLRGL